MKKTGYTEDQIAYAFRHAQTGAPVGEIIRKTGISTQTSYRWKKQYGQMGVEEIRRLKQHSGNSLSVHSVPKSPGHLTHNVHGIMRRN